jgi:hypothetical protein
MDVLGGYVQRLQNLESFDVWSVDKEGAPVFWYSQDPGEIVRELVIPDHQLAIAAQTVAAQVFHWGRLFAQQKRIHEIREREYRVWKAKQYVAAIEGADKKPSDTVIEAKYRTHPEYGKYAAEVERAAEVMNTLEHVYFAFQAKANMLRSRFDRTGA